MRELARVAALRWAVAFILIAITGAVGFATFVSAVTFMVKGFPPLNAHTLEALGMIWRFWLGIGYGVGMIGAMAFALKFLFGPCMAGYRLRPLNCRGEVAEPLRAKGYFKIWRKWFFALIWVNAAEAIILMSVHALTVGGGIWLGWFSPVWFSVMILFAGCGAVAIMLRRLERIKAEPCGS